MRYRDISGAMRVFHLQPTEDGLDDPAWAVSWYRGPCHVRANSPEAARRFANGAFTIAICPGGAPAGCGGLPWSQPRLVTVRELSGIPVESLGPPGSVVTTAPPPPIAAAAADPGLPWPWPALDPVGP